MISFSNGTAGKTTTDEELEEMLDGGNAAVFTAGVCVPSLSQHHSFGLLLMLQVFLPTSIRLYNSLLCHAPIQ